MFFLLIIIAVHYFHIFVWQNNVLLKMLIAQVIDGNGLF